jgi:hypothetical protein
MTARPPRLALSSSLGALCLVLAGCGSGGGASDNAATPVATGDLVRRVEALNEKERAGVLFRAIRDAGRDCQGVVRSVVAPAAAGEAHPGWVATCDDGGEWLVVLRANGMAVVSGARAAPGG